MRQSHANTRYVLAALTLAVLATGQVPAQRCAAQDAPIPGGQLQIVGLDAPTAGLCPLEHTDVECDIAGFIARTTVRQTFSNPSDAKIEAVYVFPLPQNATVDDMVMTIGDRRVVGRIKPREEAQAIYEAAKEAGHVAALLDQERPNIFTQAVANIEPGARVVIEISFVETLKYEDGEFEWVFPMVVGPRYNPGGGSAPAPMTRGNPTPQVPDAGRITPPVVPQGTRSGHDVSLKVNIDAGMEISGLLSKLHEVVVARPESGTAVVTLRDLAVIPNRDFVLRYRLSTDEIGDALRVHEDDRGKFFTLILQPPRRVAPQRMVPRELVFVLDTSGSMKGYPIETAKKVMSRAIETMQPGDTFNLITFAGGTHILWKAPRPATPENITEAQNFLASRSGSGGTEMMKAIEAALAPTSADGSAADELTFDQLAGLPADGREVSIYHVFRGELLDEVTRTPQKLLIPAAGGVQIPLEIQSWSVRTGLIDPNIGLPVRFTGHWVNDEGRPTFFVQHADWTDARKPAPIRVVCFMTDGYVGNDMAIIGAVRKHAGTTRVFSFGIGNSVNRFLLEGMAAAGRGEVEFVTLIDASQTGPADAAAERFHERVLAPVLTDIELDWGDLPVADVYPRRIPDLFSARPLVVHGRLTGPAQGTITLRGNTGMGPYETRMQMDEADATEHPALASLWARAKIDDLMMQDMLGMQTANDSGADPDAYPRIVDLKSQITALGVEFRLMTQFTSFVAVEETTVTIDGQPVRVDVPVEMPAGVRYEGVFGESAEGRGDVLVTGAFAFPTGKMPSSPQVLGWSERAAAVSGRDALGFDRLVRERVTPADAPASQPIEQPADVTPLDPDQAWKAKLESGLAELPDRVAAAGGEGTITVDGIEVRAFRVGIIVTLAELSDASRAALRELGFVLADEREAMKMLIGSIDVRKLEELANLDVVKRVTPIKS